jgi:hypothetical protein
MTGQGAGRHIGGGRGQSNWLRLALTIREFALAANMKSAKAAKRAVCFNILEISLLFCVLIFSDFSYR